MQTTARAAVDNSQAEDERHRRPTPSLSEAGGKPNRWPDAFLKKKAE